MLPPLRSMARLIRIFNLFVQIIATCATFPRLFAEFQRFGISRGVVEKLWQKPGDGGFEFLVQSNEWNDEDTNQDTDQEQNQDDQDEHSDEEEEDRPRSKSLEVLGLQPKALGPKQKLTRWQSVEL